MDNFENKNSNPQGQLNGFDDVKKTTDPESDKPEEKTESQYTVTPEGGYYTKTKDDIIQDDISPANNNVGNQEASTTQNIEKDNTQPNNPYQSRYTQNPYAGYNYKPQKPKKPKKSRNPKKHSTGVVIAACFLSAIIGLSGGLLGGFVSNVLERKIENNPSSHSQSDNSDNTTGNLNINIEETAESVVEAVAKKVTPSVIGIRTTTSVMSFFGGSSEATGEGSGVIYSSDGYIITNYHVIADAVANKSGSKIEVFLDTDLEKAHPATVVGYHISADLAVIKIDVTGLPTVEIADSKTLEVGQYVITIGNPGGLEFMDSVTYGIVSGLNRVVSSDNGIELIQTDAAINPGNSGGALVNTKGQLVGINSSKIVSEEYEGMGFAIPSNTVVDICKDIISNENSPEPYVGISISEKYTPEVLDYYGYPTGAVILSVSENSPAYNAGIRKGDIITEYNGTKITKYQVLEDCINKSVPDQKVNIKLYRGGRYYTTTLTVGSNNQVD